jgi:hypothetical protein
MTGGGEMRFNADEAMTAAEGAKQKAARRMTMRASRPRTNV